MEARIPGARWFHRPRNPILRVGILTGIYLSVVMIAAVLLANRASWLGGDANLRNWIARGVFALAMLLPIAVFCKSAGRLVAAGMLGWVIALLTYVSLGFYFEDLYTRLRTPGQFFMLGAVVYGVAAVMSWVGSLVVGARSHHHAVLTSSRRELH